MTNCAIKKYTDDSLDYDRMSLVIYMSNYVDLGIEFYFLLLQV